MRSTSAYRNVCLAVVALLAVAPLSAYQEQEPQHGKEKAVEREREPERKEAPRAEPGRPEPARVEPARPAGHENPAPGRGMVREPGPELREAPRPGPAPHPLPHDVRPLNVVRTPNGGEIHRAPGGAIREVHVPGGAVVHIAPNGMRHIELARPDGRVFFANGNGHGGFVQRPLMFGGHSFVQRTYVEHGVVYARVYRPYAFRGVTFNVYMPAHYYRPGFYSWGYRAYYPAPRPYRWGWNGRPWYGYYGRYWTPYPTYAGPLFWLTDFLIATTLEQSYQARLDAGMPPPPPSGYGLDPNTQQAISDEVSRQLAQEQQQQAMASGYVLPANTPPPMFSQNVSRIFLVSTPTPAYFRGQEVALSGGVVLQLSGPPAPGSAYADVRVMASPDASVPRGSMVSVSVMDLQEMQNRMQANLDQGLGTLQSQQAGLPPPPPEDLGGVNAPYAGAAQPDPGAAGELSQVAMDANNASQGMINSPVAAAPQPAPFPPPAGNSSIALGMSADQVHAILGNPRQSASAGSKWIEIYPNFKVTYLNGVVSDIQ